VLAHPQTLSLSTPWQRRPHMKQNASTALRALTILLACCGVYWISARSTVSAQSAVGAETAVRDALLKWTIDFNTRNTSRICDLFAPDLVYDYRGFPERGYDALCGLLHRSLNDRTKKFTYFLDIKEIIVAGDLAIVRLVWTLNVTSPDTSEAKGSIEPGLDVFRRQPDGSWRIIRYIAYEAP
jgi:uncharacterized protein (TIGR02246 family)